MARPTNESRVIQLIKDFGAVNPDGHLALSLSKLRRTLGPNADTAILNLIASGVLSTCSHHSERYVAYVDEGF